MLDTQQAVAVAAAFLAGYDPEEVGGVVRVVPEWAFVDGDRLIIPYNTVDALDHGIEDAELGGHTPIFVDLKSGECGFITIEAVFEYMERGFSF